MYEMEGPSPGLRGESSPISRASFSPLGHHRTSDHLNRRLPDFPAAESHPREVSPAVPISPRWPSVSVTCVFLLPPSESRKGFNQRFQDFRSLHSPIHRIRIVIPRTDKFLHRLSTSRDDVRPRMARAAIAAQPARCPLHRKHRHAETGRSRSRVGLPGRQLPRRSRRRPAGDGTVASRARSGVSRRDTIAP
jgi:hypothetical protein